MDLDTFRQRMEHLDACCRNEGGHHRHHDNPRHTPKGFRKTSPCTEPFILRCHMNRFHFRRLPINEIERIEIKNLLTAEAYDLISCAGPLPDELSYYGRMRLDSVRPVRCQE